MGINDGSRASCSGYCVFRVSDISMTCVIGSPTFICGDRKIMSDGGDKCPSRRKVFRNDYMAVGVAGWSKAITDIESLVRTGSSDPRIFLSSLGDHSSALCLIQGELWLAEEGEVSKCKYPWYCIGSGADLATGFLGARNAMPSRDRCRAALKFVASRRDDCGARGDFV